MSKSAIIKRKELVSDISDKSGIDYELVDKVTRMFLDEIKQKLLNDQDVSFSNERFGRFEVVKGKSRRVRLPDSDEPLDIPERKRVKFRPSSTLKIVSD